MAGGERSYLVLLPFFPPNVLAAQLGSSLSFQSDVVFFKGITYNFSCQTP